MGTDGDTVAQHKKEKVARRKVSSRFLIPLQVFSYWMANTCLYPRNIFSFLPVTGCGKSFILIKIKIRKKNSNLNRYVI